MVLKVLKIGTLLLNFSGWMSKRSYQLQKKKFEVNRMGPKKTLQELIACH